MKRILITGKDSYIGNKFRSFVSSEKNILVEEIDVRNDEWEDHDFSKYDSIVHVAAIVHKANPSNRLEELYTKVNTILPYRIAEKAKNQGVKQFVFMSSMSVYGEQSGDYKIDGTTKETPNSLYGISKYEAEKRLETLKDENFNICILRPPMVYGFDTKGNYPRLSKLAQKLPIFPKINNERSMIYIDTLCNFIKLMVVNQESGVFFPQNRYYVNTSQLVKEIRKIHGKKTILIPGFSWLLNLLSRRFLIFNKVFSSLIYDQELSKYIEDYRNISFEETVKKSEIQIRG